MLVRAYLAVDVNGMVPIRDGKGRLILSLQVRHDPRYETHLPIMIHINSHPDKAPRMLAVVRRYVDGDITALDRFPDGSE